LGTLLVYFRNRTKMSRIRNTGQSHGTLPTTMFDSVE
jgi:hypothetical protein